jgi:hypothetical protein
MKALILYDFVICQVSSVYFLEYQSEKKSLANLNKDLYAKY